MQELLHAFGIDWRLIVIQIFNFVVLAGALVYFLYTPILKILNDREHKIRKGVEDAEKAEVFLQEADSEKDAILTLANSEAADIIARGSARGEEKGAGIVKEAEEKAVRTLEESRKRAEEIKRQAEKESEADIAKIALLATEKMLATKLDA